MVSEVGVRSTLDAAGWVLVGGVPAAGFGALIAGSESVGFGAVVASVIAGVTLVAWSLWRREEARHPVPVAEYFAAVWALAYISVLVALAAVGNRYELGEAMVLYPPVSVLPLALRTSLGDDGFARGRARTVARHLHRWCGWMLTALGVAFVLSWFFIFVAPLSLVPGLLHLHAASRYRSARATGEPTGERLVMTGRR